MEGVEPPFYSLQENRISTYATSAKATGLGFAPRIQDSKSCVLLLHHPAKGGEGGSRTHTPE
jgi:hypothetical protein